MWIPDYSSWRWLAPIALVAIIAALIAHRVLRAVLPRLVRFSPWLTALIRRADPPVQWLLPLLALQALWQAAPDTLPGITGLRHLTAVLLIVGFSWLAMQAVRAVADVINERHPVDVADNLHARRIQTQTRVLARTAITVVVVAGAAFILMTFPGGRQLGASLLASAGVAGLIIGLAARSVVSNLLAGLQIALTQPFRIDDVLIVEGEYGRVEEINSTYVVLHIWDDRRLIVPFQRLIEQPFQNWTRTSAQLLGAVTLWFDYTMPVEPLRKEAQRICEASPHWDGRVCGVQVVDASERGMQVRVLVSAESSGEAWNLRCQVREALIDFAQKHYPQSLPRLRLEGDKPPPRPAAPPPPPPHETPPDASGAPGDWR